MKPPSSMKSCPIPKAASRHRQQLLPLHTLPGRNRTGCRAMKPPHGQPREWRRGGEAISPWPASILSLKSLSLNPSRELVEVRAELGASVRLDLCARKRLSASVRQHQHHALQGLGIWQGRNPNRETCSDNHRTAHLGDIWQDGPARMLNQQ